MVDVIGTEEFADWFGELGETDKTSVARVVDMLDGTGVALPFPYSSAIHGAKYPLRELRIQSGGKPIRIFYAFDPIRRAVL